ncbi:MAG: PEP-CTERM sorting domain-containing protein, partial [Pirellulales bacterium]|nr:PEP-CTERM sorting domain-containing protein [Pirellulales bacterium]
GTLFFQVYLDGDIDAGIGLSDQAAPNGFGAFESYAIPDDAGPNNIAVRNGGSSQDTGFDYTPFQWANVWVVTDNSTDTTDVYWETPVGGSGQVQVADDFAFRNGTSAALESFLTIITNSNGVGENYFLDNIYVDNTGVNLLNPVPEPGSFVLLFIGLLGIATQHRD